MFLLAIVMVAFVTTFICCLLVLLRLLSLLLHVAVVVRIVACVVRMAIAIAMLLGSLLIVSTMVLIMACFNNYSIQLQLQQYSDVVKACESDARYERVASEIEREELFDEWIDRTERRQRERESRERIENMRTLMATLSDKDSAITVSTTWRCAP